METSDQDFPALEATTDTNAQPAIESDDTDDMLDSESAAAPVHVADDEFGSGPGIAAAADHDGNVASDAPELATAALTVDGEVDADEPDFDAPDELQTGGFESLGLAPHVAATVAALGYETPTDVQLHCIPPLLAGRDLVGQAQTGTGKTAAFALPLLSRLFTDGAAGVDDSEIAGPRVLVLAPTRELALQVSEAFQRYAAGIPGFHVAPIYGGQGYSQQIRSLKRNPSVVVGTPGRVMDHMRRGTLSLASLRTLVLDEADEMLAMGFAEDIDWIFDYIPEERQVALFSATMPDTIRRVAQQRLRNPVELRLTTANLTVDTIDQQHVVVTRAHKLDLLTRLLELEPVQGSVVFVRTRHATAELAERLKAHGFAAEALHGDMDQTLRERTIDGLRAGRLDVVVATDVAARGLDVERVTHVINFDIPTDPQAYVHRIGRTGRAGRAGRAILMVEPRERGLLRAIERTIGRTVPRMAVPTAAALTASRIDRFTSELREALAMQDLDFFYQLVTNIAKEQELDLLDIAAAMAFQLQKDRPLEVTEELHLPKHEDREHRPRDDDRRPRFGDRQRPDGDRPRYEGRRPEGDRAAFQPRRQDGDRAPFQPRQEQGDRTPFQPRQQDGNRPPFQPRQQDGERPRYEGRRPDGDRAPFQPRPTEGNRPPFEPRRPDGDRPRFEPRRQEGDRPDFNRQERPRPDGNRAEGYRPDGNRAEGLRPDGNREERPRPPGRTQGTGELTSYRIEVGRNQGVTPREIVGAIANEAQLDGRYIGRIEISDNHSTVDLPAGMPKDVFEHLKGVYVCGQPLAISHGGGGGGGGAPYSPRREDDRGERPRPPAGPGGAPRRFEPGAPRGNRDDGGFKRKRRD